MTTTSRLEVYYLLPQTGRTGQIAPFRTPRRDLTCDQIASNLTGFDHQFDHPHPHFLEFYGVRGLSPLFRILRGAGFHPVLLQ